LVGLIKRMVTRGKKLAFVKMRHVGLVEAKVKALRTDAARRLVKMVLSKSTSKLGWSFNRWVRIVQHQRVEVG